MPAALLPNLRPLIRYYFRDSNQVHVAIDVLNELLIYVQLLLHDV